MGGVIERYHEYQRIVGRMAELRQLESLTRLQGIERLQSLQSLQSLHGDYADAVEKINRQYDDILIYCDPPYNSTNCGKYKGFDNDRFYKWARKQNNI